jgi:hypothetical protein
MDQIAPFAMPHRRHDAGAEGLVLQRLRFDY